MTKETGKLRRLSTELKEIADEIDRDPIPEDAPLLYEEMCLEIYGSAPHFGGDALYLKHTCRDDLGVVMIKEKSPIHTALQTVIDEK